MRAHLRTLGAFELRLDGRAIARPSTQKARALLAYLCLHQGNSVARDDIVERFWPESAPENARQNLKTALWSIRRVLRDAGADANDFIASDHFTIRWTDATTVDALEFERAALAREASALERYGGEFLPGDYDDWSAAQRERLIGVLESLLSAVVEKAGDVAAAARLIAIDPFNETAYAALIDAELAAQRTAGAQVLIERFRRVMNENGLTPSRSFEARFSSLSASAPATTGMRFVGRVRELGSFERSLRSTDRATFVVHGDAGFGKTALLEQFKRRAVSLGRPIVAVAAAREKSGFGAWEAIYRDRTGCDVATLAGERGKNLAGALAQGIAQTLGKGTYVFIDDAHYLEGDAAFVTAALVDAGRQNAISFVIATRPEGLRSVLAWCKSDSVEVPLEGLSADDVRVALGERGDDAIAATLYERTGGHPLFLQRVLERIAEGAVRLDMPEGVRALIEERLRERGEDAYAIAGLLAIDRRFSGEELAAMLDWDETRALDAIDDLLALGIVRESESAELEFTHDVVMEVARDSSSPQRRRRFHRVAASMLEKATRLSDMARGAEHKAAAGETEAAARLYLRCAKAAFESFEPRNAFALADTARAQAEQLDRSPANRRLIVEIDAMRVRALNDAADSTLAERIAGAAMREAESLDDPKLLFETINLRMRSRMRGASIDPIVEDARAAMDLAEKLGDPIMRAEAALGLLQTSMQRVNETDALRYGNLAFDAALEGGDVDFALFVASELLHAKSIFWRFGDAMVTLDRCERLLHSASGSTEPNFQYGAAQLMYVLNAHDEAERRLDRAQHVLQGQRSKVGRFMPDRQRIVAIITNLRGLVAVAKGDWEAACAAADAFAANPAAQTSGIHAHVVDLQTRALIGRNGPGDVDRAAAMLDTLRPEMLVEDTRMYADVARARVAARRRDSGAAALLEAAIASVEETVALAGLDADHVFNDLAAAARECGAADAAGKAEALAERYLEKRRAAAGPYWAVGPAALRADRPAVL